MNVNQFLQKTISQLGFQREKFIETSLPASLDDIVFISFFGDFNSLSLFSSVILPNWLKKHYPDKYVICASYPGLSSLFHYCQEYWMIADQLTIADLYADSYYFINKSKKYEIYTKNIRKYLDKTYFEEDFLKYSNNGLTHLFLQEFGENFVVQYPYAVSPKLEWQEKLGKSVGLFPTKLMAGFQKYHRKYTLTKDFWIQLINRLLNLGFTPFIWQNYATYDLSPDFGNKCVYISENNFSMVLAGMRLVNVGLDVFTGFGKLLCLGHVPQLHIEDRLLYRNYKLYEVLDLTNKMFSNHIISYAYLVHEHQHGYLIDQIIRKLDSFDNKKDSITELTSQTNYDKVRIHKPLQIGLNFVQVEKLVF